MGDNEVLAKLSQGDMVATDAKYHLRCLVEYKNRYRFKSSDKILKGSSSLIEGIFSLSYSFSQYIQRWYIRYFKTSFV